MTFDTRITKVIEYSGLTASDFADEIEVQRSNISHITSGRNKPSLDFIKKIKNKFPELSWDWLINGEGDMLEKQEKAYEKTTPKKEITTTPPLDLFSFANQDINENLNLEKHKISNNAPESPIQVEPTEKKNITHSQPLAYKETLYTCQNTDNKKVKIKRIVIFFEDGTFESFEG
ncbi:helix-turn-helix domain-containing protein [Riemerella columbipharyngis]|uniref:DNA-binding transcriptional regulator, XRE-family HTH domain n=1 Tax=Riemerella columbipharyngis TaxID=1071918 RepID=A0A1G6ZLJ0_9FLAO|nr:helix-turn-helix transcriptional regulator [Riemerella columbipharyngis]SDE02426.1 DNA-binding transcriptional regulator, XRE-family HTH domain [Riemerella columbipharyngis]